MSKGPVWKKNIILRGTLEVLTGLHIGGMAESLKIGGVDSPVIRAPVFIEKTGEYKYLPVISGSSLKGKMRALLDLAEGHINWEESNNKGETETRCFRDGKNSECMICKVFGHPALDKVPENQSALYSTRLIVRDAVPTEETIEWWDELEEVIDGGEIKPENSVNRITSRANPRFIERVPAGSRFKVKFIIRIYDNDDEKEIEKFVMKAIEMLNDDYLGGHGTRGYGKVRIEITERAERTAEYYEKKAETLLKNLKE